MFGQALRVGLIVWAKFPLTIFIGAALLLGWLTICYALAVQIDLSVHLTIAIWVWTATFGVAGWTQFNIRLIRGKRTWSALFSGFRNPLFVGLIGVAMAIAVSGLSYIARYLTTEFPHNSWPIGAYWLVTACCLIPIFYRALIGVTEERVPGEAVNPSIRRAIGSWLTLTVIALLTFGFLVAGAAPGLLLEQHALPEIGRILPARIAEFDLAIVRSITLFGGLVGISMAGCVWGAAWTRTDTAQSSADQ